MASERRRRSEAARGVRPMARYEHLPIYRAAFDLAVHVEKIVRNFSRYHKYSLGTELRERSRRVLERIMEANQSRERAALLGQLRLELEQLKLLARLCHESGGFASTRAYLHVARAGGGDLAAERGLAAAGRETAGRSVASGRKRSIGGGGAWPEPGGLNGSSGRAGSVMVRPSRPPRRRACSFRPPYPVAGIGGRWSRRARRFRREKRADFARVLRGAVEQLLVVDVPTPVTRTTRGTRT